jgi:hypothetical protein
LVNAAVAESIHELAPLETGGVEARQGLGFQDHIAAGFCIEMLQDDALTEVWCESQDDVTLIWMKVDGQMVEFVQVKRNEPDRLWSIAMLCKRERKARNTGGIEDGNKDAASIDDSEDGNRTGRKQGRS